MSVEKRKEKKKKRDKVKKKKLNKKVILNILFNQLRPKKVQFILQVRHKVK